MRDAVQHAAGHAVAGGHHDLRGLLLLAVGLLALARVGDVWHGAAHREISALQLRVCQLDVVFHGQRDIRHRAQSRLHVGAAEDLGRRAVGRRHAARRQEHLAVTLPILGEVAAPAAAVGVAATTEATALVDAIVDRVVDEAMRTTVCRERARRGGRVEHRHRLLVLARTCAVVLEIDVVRMVHPDLRQKSVSRDHS